MLSFLPKTPSDIQNKLKEKFRSRRKALKLTQQELATRSDVSLGSLKCFESSGKIALESLLKLAFVLVYLGDFGSLCEAQEERFGSIEEVVK
ncbi:MAG: helix-turn-helix domain-containing protein [Sulfurovum sp.]|nr:helix-turn-helix domain-containing protein [Sulfurovum sp.]